MVLHIGTRHLLSRDKAWRHSVAGSHLRDAGVPRRNLKAHRLRYAHWLGDPHCLRRVTRICLLGIPLHHRCSLLIAVARHLLWVCCRRESLLLGVAAVSHRRNTCWLVGGILGLKKDLAGVFPFEFHRELM